jgi:hypothetical protein
MLTCYGLFWLLQVRNEKARRFLANMRKKPGVDLAAFFPRADRGALALLRRLLAFDPADRWGSSTVTACLLNPAYAWFQWALAKCVFCAACCCGRSAVPASCFNCCM